MSNQALSLSPLASLILNIPNDDLKNATEILTRTSLSDTFITCGVEQNNFSLQPLPLPHGTVIHRFLLYLASYSVKKISENKDWNYHVPLGNSPKEFLNELGFDSASWKSELADQIQRLFSCRIDHPFFYQADISEFKKIEEIVNEKADHSKEITKQAHSSLVFDYRRRVIIDYQLWSTKTSDHASDIEPYVMVNPYLFTDQFAEPYPLVTRYDFPVMREHFYKRKADILASRIYVFLADLLPRIQGKKPVNIGWDVIHTQIFNNYRDERKFRNAFMNKYREKVSAAYPASVGKVKSDTDFLYLCRAAPPILDEYTSIPSY